MKIFVSALIAGLAVAEPIDAKQALVKLSEEDSILLDEGVITQEDIIMHSEDLTSEVILLPEPLVSLSVDAEKPPGKWTDEQKLTLETFKEIVATDVENIWVVAYIDPRCRDCLILSVEWEKLTQIEERERRKIKLGYVDISVEENWKIIQDHTKGKKMTHTPAVSLYGDDKVHPHFYEPNHPSADGVHKWVSSYADYHGYGWWNPEQYDGATAHPSYQGLHGQSDDGINRHGYGIEKRQGHDSKKHDGALQKVGVYTGYGGKGYTTEGKWQKGDQETQLKLGDGESVMRRRTITAGGSLTGAAHNAPDSKIYGAAPSYKQRQALAAGGSKYGRYQGEGKYGSGFAGTYGGRAFYGGQNYGDIHSFGITGYASSGYGAFLRKRLQGTKYGRSYGTGKGHGSYETRRNGGRKVNGKNSGKYGKKNSYGGPSPYDRVGAKGHYGDPNTKYYGPGLHGVAKSQESYQAKYDPVLGKGIVLGKYSRTTGDSKSYTDFDEKDIAGPDTQLYKDAQDLAQRSGTGQTDIPIDHFLRRFRPNKSGIENKEVTNDEMKLFVADKMAVFNDEALDISDTDYGTIEFEIEVPEHE